MIRDIHALPEDAVLDVAEVAAWLGVSLRWVQSHSNKSRRPYLPAMKVGKFLKYRKGAVQKTIEQWQKDRENAA
jgi:hypothetical protein